MNIKVSSSLILLFASSAFASSTNLGPATCTLNDPQHVFFEPSRGNSAVRNGRNTFRLEADQHGVYLYANNDRTNITRFSSLSLNANSTQVSGSSHSSAAMGGFGRGWQWFGNITGSITGFFTGQESQVWKSSYSSQIHINRQGFNLNVHNVATKYDGTIENKNGLLSCHFDQALELPELVSAGQGHGGAVVNSLNRGSKDIPTGSNAHHHSSGAVSH